MKTYIQRTVSETVMATPDDFFGKLNRIFRFTIDVCALPINAKCESYFTPEMDGLSQDWVGGIWCNPPYGIEIEDWCRKASEEYMKDYCEFIVMLIPARTDTKWFHKYVLPHARLIIPIRGRLKFRGLKQSAPFPSVLAVYMKEIRA